MTKQLVILSGKGGTGKTTFTAALAHLAAQELSIVMADADVDAANLELVLDPQQVSQHDFFGGQLAFIDPDVCTSCGTCASVCRFDAVTSDPYTVDPVACEGCAACYFQCPVEAIHMEEQRAGLWFHSTTRFGPLFHAHLFAGQENSGKLVTQVKLRARVAAADQGADLVLVDGPPGIGCPVISAVGGADLALMVVEPTVSGAHDLVRILGTADHFGVPAVVAINKADLNPARSDEITAFCQEQGIEVVGRVPYDTVVTEAMVQGQPVTAFSDGSVSQSLRQVWARVWGVLG
ncbi:MAG: ATP-binding protein [Anaerolineae bacterium]|nr:ATP-binding protein [Anaerolineae bacterium]